MPHDRFVAWPFPTHPRFVPRRNDSTQGEGHEDTRGRSADMADMCCDRVLRRGHRLAAGARRGYRFIREVKRTKVEATPDDASAYRQQAATAFDADLTDIARRFHGAARLRSVRSGHDDRRARSTGRAVARDPFRPRWGSFRQTGRRMNAPCCDGSAGRAAVLTSAREGRRS